MELVQQGDGEAYRELLGGLEPQVRRFLRRRFPPIHDVDDVCQDVMIALHTSRHTYEPGRSFDAWFFAIATHTAIDHVRRTKRRSARETVALEELAEQGERGQEALGHGLREALEALPASQREALRLVRLDGLSMKDAASRAGTTEGAMKVRAHRAFKALRSLLSR